MLPSLIDTCHYWRRVAVKLGTVAWMIEEFEGYSLHRLSVILCGGSWRNVS
jgi:hypothetical protein